MPGSRGPSPTVRRWRLAKALREAREEREIPAVEVAKALGWGSTKPGYLENRHAERPKPADVAALCEYYGLPGDEREELVQLAVDSGIRGWWEPYKKSLSRDYTTFIGLEAETSKIETFETSILPGLLQTKRYAEACLSRGRAQHDPKAVAKRVAVRVERQKILTAADPAQLHAIVDEAAIRRLVGGPEVMRAQLEHLLELATLPHITLRVVPFNRGEHAGTGGSFAILHFPDARDDSIAYLETVAGQLFVEEESEVADYTAAFSRLQNDALGVADTIAVMAAAAATI